MAAIAARASPGTQRGDSLWTVMNQDQPSDSDDRVVPLRPRKPGMSGPSRPAPSEPDPPDLSRFEDGGDDDDYRHRMLTNVAALAFVGLLVVGGVWIANTIAEMRKNQDCVLSGRRGCSPVQVPSADR